ncbi:MAG: hypothetical protein M3O02_01530 [Acidobacteriota bacterium]|nr:hypothetical protein [Acidobacteriota bacterium]
MQRARGVWRARVGTAAVLTASLCALKAQAPSTQPTAGAQAIVNTMLANEDAASKRRDRFQYMNKERSDRTGGHLWAEKVVETAAGKVRMLLEEDGQPLSAERVAGERGRLAAIVADPAGFARREQATKDDEAKAKQMLSVLPRAFDFDNVRDENGMLRIELRPKADFSPASMEERVLHGMSGALWVDAKAMRLHRIEGKLPTDMSIGFGLLATIRAGSNFDTERAPFEGGEWKTVLVDSDINGKAIFFKSISRRQHTEHTEFRRVPNEITVQQAVAMVEQ